MIGPFTIGGAVRWRGTLRYAVELARNSQPWIFVAQVSAPKYADEMAVAGDICGTQSLDHQEAASNFRSGALRRSGVGRIGPQVWKASLMPETSFDMSARRHCS